MKKFTKKSVIQKIVSILTIIILFEHTVPNVAKASDDWGGVLFTPVQTFTLAIGDVFSNLIDFTVVGESGSVLTLSRSTLFEKILNWFTTTFKPGNPTATAVNTVFKSIDFGEDDFKDEIELPTIKVTPDKIFANKIPLLDVNIINPNKYEDADGNDASSSSSAAILQKTISGWYIALRNIAIVAFLSVLIYIGIRILLCSTGQDKAKYKQMLMDWFVGLCLVFCIHYIMSFALMVTEKITDLISSGIGGVEITSDSPNTNLSDTGVDGVEAFKMDDDDKLIIARYNNSSDGNLKWKTDIMGYVRFFAQTNIKSLNTVTQMGYTIMYLVLVIYTVMFLFQYLKRLFNIVFLTLIAPLVALAYPLDKLADGHAQAFNMWFKEYIFNLLLQPMHLILYIVLAGSAMDLVTEHPIYAVVVLGFLLQSEKLVRKFFGFEKASTTGALASGAFTGAMLMNGINKIKAGAGHSSKPSKKKTIGSAEDDTSKIRYDRKSDMSSDDNNEFMDSVLLRAGVNGENDNTTEKPARDTKVKDNNIKDPALENPNYMYMHPNEYDDNNNYIGSGSGTESGIRQANLPKLDNLPKNDLPKSKININASSKPIRTIKNPTSYKVPKGQLAKGAIKYYGPKVGMGLLKAGVKGSAMAIGAGTLGMMGLAAGLATDDESNIGKYALAGIASGAAVGNSVANRAINTSGNLTDSIKQRTANVRQNIANKAFENDTKAYQAYINDRADKEFLKDKKVQEKYAQEFGKENATEMMNAAIAYRERGVTDDEIIIKAMKQKSPVLGDVTDDRRISSAMYASKISDEKGIERMSKRLKEKGVSEKTIKEQEQIVRNIRGLI